MFAVAVGDDLGVLSAEISSIEGRNLTLNALEDFAQGFPPNHWRIQAGAPGTRAPPGGPNSFIFMQFSAKN